MPQIDRLTDQNEYVCADCKKKFGGKDPMHKWESLVICQTCYNARRNKILNLPTPPPPMIGYESKTNPARDWRATKIFFIAGKWCRNHKRIASAIVLLAIIFIWNLGELPSAREIATQARADAERAGAAKLVKQGILMQFNGWIKYDDEVGFPTSQYRIIHIVDDENAIVEISDWDRHETVWLHAFMFGKVDGHSYEPTGIWIAHGTVKYESSTIFDVYQTLDLKLFKILVQIAAQDQKKPLPKGLGFEDAQ